MKPRIQVEAEVYGSKHTEEGIKIEIYRALFEKKAYSIDLLIPEALMDGLKGGDKLLITIQQKENE